MPTLYDITSDILRIADDVDENGEMPANVELQLDALEMDFATKADQICRYRAQCVGESERFKAEADRLTLLARSQANRAERLKKYLQLCMETAGLQKLDTELFKLGIQSNSVPSVKIREGMEIPEAFRRVTVELDSAKVIAAAKAGHELPDGITCIKGSHLRIR